MIYLLEYSSFENENYGLNEKEDMELISDIFLEYHEKWNLREEVALENLGRYLLLVEFRTWDHENETIIDSKVNKSTIDEFRSDIDSFIERMKKYAGICFASWTNGEDDYGYTIDDEYVSVWIYVDFCKIK